MSRHAHFSGPAALFPTLPDPVRHNLLLGSCGVLHLLDTAGQVLCHAKTGKSCSASSDQPGDQSKPDQELAAMAMDMLLAALGERPLARDLAAQILSLPDVASRLSSRQQRELGLLARTAPPPESARHFQRLAAQRDMDRLRAFVLSRAKAEPDQLFWREQLLILSVAEGDPDLAARALDAEILRNMPGVHAALGWQAACLDQDFPRAAELARQCAPLFGTGFAATREAEALLAQEKRSQGVAALLRGVTASPWRTNELLRVHELLEQWDTARIPMRGDVRILLYTWNKGHDLDEALQTLAESDLGMARITVLNNGSTDQTAAVLGAWQARLGRERLGIVELPVNIGAPAARNWLLHTEARDADWVVYLDDDALVPRDWLALFGAVVARQPEAGVWGCRVVDHAQPMLAQAVDYQPAPLSREQHCPAEPDLTRLQPHPFKLSNLHIQGLDRGQFEYVRPCASVTGCCHLFRRDRMAEAGDFSLFLSPSQYDDMERDLRVLASGRTAAYQGHLRVRHKKRTGRDSLLPGPENSNALGNRYKMQVLHGPQEVEHSARQVFEALEADLLARLDRVQDALKPLDHPEE